MATAGDDIEGQMIDDEKNDFSKPLDGNANTIHQEVVIDIHVRHLKLQIDEIMNQPDSPEE